MDTDPRERQPKGDHNRRIDLGLSREQLAAEAGLTAEEVRLYEATGPDQPFEVEVARRIGEALVRLEANPPPTQQVLT